MIGTRTKRPPRDKVLALGLFMAAFVASMLGAAGPAFADAFTVNRRGNAPDANLANASCDSNASQAGNQCTLRAAIQEANDTSGADVIRFNIQSSANVKTISPASPLPNVTGEITINGYSQSGASPNTLAAGNNAVLKIQLNGTNAGTDVNGLTITASNSTIKGLVINRFDGEGIKVEGSDATGNRVEGNFIGTNAAGTADLGNTDDGVEIFRADDNTVGGTAAGARNVISGNGGTGALVFDPSTGNEILGNFLGTDATGTADLGNDGNGVQIFNAPDNTIGGTVAGAGNRIAHNDGDGVFAFFADSLGNRVLSNQIFSNGGVGIDLAPVNGVTANDTDDPDTGPNNLQNFPVIMQAVRLSTGIAIVSGTLNSNPNQDFTVQCFVAAPDPSAHGEGRTLAGQDTTVTTDPGGDGTFTCVSPLPQAGQAVTATATNTATGDTSEFSRIAGVVPGP